MLHLFFLIISKHCRSDLFVSLQEMHRSAITSLAELTSKSIEQFHKTGELILIKKAEQKDLVLTSKHLAR